MSYESTQAAGNVVARSCPEDTSPQRSRNLNAAPRVTHRGPWRLGARLLNKAKLSARAHWGGLEWMAIFLDDSWRRVAAMVDDTVLDPCSLKQSSGACATSMTHES